MMEANPSPTSTSSLDAVEDNIADSTSRQQIPGAPHDIEHITSVSTEQSNIECTLVSGPLTQQESHRCPSRDCDDVNISKHHRSPSTQSSSLIDLSEAIPDLDDSSKDNTSTGLQELNSIKHLLDLSQLVAANKEKTAGGNALLLSIADTLRDSIVDFQSSPPLDQSPDSYQGDFIDWSYSHVNPYAIDQVLDHVFSIHHPTNYRTEGLNQRSIWLVQHAVKPIYHWIEGFSNRIFAESIRLHGKPKIQPFIITGTPQERYCWIVMESYDRQQACNEALMAIKDATENKVCQPEFIRDANLFFGTNNWTLKNNSERVEPIRKFLESRVCNQFVIHLMINRILEQEADNARKVNLSTAKHVSSKRLTPSSRNWATVFHSAPRMIDGHNYRRTVAVFRLLHMGNVEADELDWEDERNCDRVSETRQGDPVSEDEYQPTETSAGARKSLDHTETVITSSTEREISRSALEQAAHEVEIVEHANTMEKSIGSKSKKKSQHRKRAKKSTVIGTPQMSAKFGNNSNDGTKELTSQVQAEEVLQAMKSYSEQQGLTGLGISTSNKPIALHGDETSYEASLDTRPSRPLPSRKISRSMDVGYKKTLPSSEEHMIAVVDRLKNGGPAPSLEEKRDKDKRKRQMDKTTRRNSMQFIRSRTSSRASTIGLPLHIDVPIKVETDTPKSPSDSDSINTVVQSRPITPNRQSKETSAFDLTESDTAEGSSTSNAVPAFHSKISDSNDKKKESASIPQELDLTPLNSDLPVTQADLPPAGTGVPRRKPKYKSKASRASKPGRKDARDKPLATKEALLSGGGNVQDVSQDDTAIAPSFQGDSGKLSALDMQRKMAKNDIQKSKIVSYKSTEEEHTQSPRLFPGTGTTHEKKAQESLISKNPSSIKTEQNVSNVTTSQEALQMTSGWEESIHIEAPSTVHIAVPPTAISPVSENDHATHGGAVNVAMLPETMLSNTTDISTEGLQLCSSIHKQPLIEPSITETCANDTTLNQAPQSNAPNDNSMPGDDARCSVSTDGIAKDRRNEGSSVSAGEGSTDEGIGRYDNYPAVHFCCPIGGPLCPHNHTWAQGTGPAYGSTTFEHYQQYPNVSGIPDYGYGSHLQPCGVHHNQQHVYGPGSSHQYFPLTAPGYGYSGQNSGTYMGPPSYSDFPYQTWYHDSHGAPSQYHGILHQSDFHGAHSIPPPYGTTHSTAWGPMGHQAPYADNESYALMDNHSVTIGTGGQDTPQYTQGGQTTLVTSQETDSAIPDSTGSLSNDGEESISLRKTHDTSLTPDTLVRDFGVTFGTFPGLPDAMKADRKLNKFIQPGLQYFCAFCYKMIHDSVDGKHSVICPGCGPCSEYRYCNEAHRLADILPHYNVCGTRPISSSIDWNILPIHLRQEFPYIKPIHDAMSPELYRQMAYAKLPCDKNIDEVFSEYVKIKLRDPELALSLSIGGGTTDYIIFSKEAKHNFHPAHICVRFDEQKHVPFRRVLAAAILSYHPNLVKFVYCAINRSIMLTEGLDTADVLDTFRDQFYKEFKGFIDFKADTPKQAALRFDFDRQYAQFGELLETLELMHPVLRAWSREPGRHADPRERMLGAGWDTTDELFADDDLSKFGQGWSGA